MDPIRRALRYLFGLGPYVLLSGAEAAWESLDAARARRAWAGLLAFSLAYGLAGAGAWSLASACFGWETLLPALAAVALVAGWFYRRAIVAAGRVLSCGRGELSVLAGLLVVSLLAVYACLRGGEAGREMDLPAWLAWARPYERHYRLLILAPLWGAWAMLIAPKLSVARASAGSNIEAFAQGCEPFAAAAALALPLLLSLFYLQFLHWWWQVLVPAISAIAAVCAGTLSVRRLGLTRSALLAANVLAQLAFLLAYLAGRHLGLKY